jgi:CheY-like chemotaxis protein
LEKDRDKDVKDIGTEQQKKASYKLPRRTNENELLLSEIRKAGNRPPVNFRGRVLVMDDEEIIRTILGVMLMAFGYETHMTANGEEALASYIAAKESGHPFDAVIIDLVIENGMEGKETMRRLLDLDPDVKAIVSSGKTDDPGVTNYWEYGFQGVLQKPYSINELRQVLNYVIKRSVPESFLNTEN